VSDATYFLLAGAYMCTVLAAYFVGRTV
jgi:hypothetical protein